MPEIAITNIDLNLILGKPVTYHDPSGWSWQGTIGEYTQTNGQKFFTIEFGATFRPISSYLNEITIDTKHLGE